MKTMIEMVMAGNLGVSLKMIQVMVLALRLK